MKSIIELSGIRVSVRDYSAAPVEIEKRKLVLDFLDNFKTGPFGNKTRFQFVDMEGEDPGEIRKLGTYGMINGSRLYLAGAVKRGEMMNEDYGYCMEAGIIKATDLGLGTCWLGGSLDRSVFAKHINLAGDELIPAVSPVGYGFKNFTILEKIIRTAIKASKKNRKPASEIFFYENIHTPLVNKNFTGYDAPLEALRLAPSASNKQPWRIVQSGSAFHFYIDEDYDYNKRRGEIKIQNVDMGIALFHFIQASAEAGLAGKLIRKNPGIDAGNWIYAASWVYGS